MQDEITPGLGKKKSRPIETTDPLDTTIGGEEPDSSIEDSTTPEQLQPEGNEVDEKKLEEEFGPPPDTSSDDEESMKATKVPLHKRPWDWIKKLSRTQKIVYSLLLLLVIGVAIFCVIMFTRKPEPVIPSTPTYRPPTSSTVPSKLTGLQVDPAINKRQVTGVMIENSTFARPQSGLNQAGVVYEAVAEAGITRFLALFQDTKSEYIGPVRSVRPYYIQWCQPFDCALAHVGGSPEALRDLPKYKVKNLDQFAGGSYFHRINTRYAPHNVYTSQASLSAYEESRDYTTSGDYTGFEHLEKEPVVKAGSATITDVRFNYPGSDYDVAYTYRANKNDYARSEGGKAHYSTDKQGKLTRNAPKVVIALVIPYSVEGDGYHSSYKTIGSGIAYVFQNGIATKGTWSKSSRESQFVLKTSDDQPIKLNPGQTWISIVGSASDVSYK